MAKQTFTTGQVLTAAQMTSLQETAMGGGPATAKTASYVLVAADAGTTVAMNAAGATTITVNTGLFAAGDTVFIQNLGAGACTVTAGTATVATAGSLILPQNDAGILYFTATGAAIFYDYIQAGAVSPLTTKGDLYTFSTSDARLGVGANGTVLTAASGEATGLQWATPSSGGMTLLSTTTLSGTSTTVSSINQTYNDLIVIINDPYINTGSTELRIDPNSTNSISNWSGTFSSSAYTDNTMYAPFYIPTSSTVTNSISVLINQYANTTYAKPFRYCGNFNGTGSPVRAINYGGAIVTASAISSLKFTTNNGTSTFSGGQVLIYGVK